MQAHCSGIAAEHAKLGFADLQTVSLLPSSPVKAQESISLKLTGHFCRGCIKPSPLHVQLHPLSITHRSPTVGLHSGDFTYSHLPLFSDFPCLGFMRSSMHTVLSARIAKLNTNLLVPPSPKQLKSEILDLAKDCQVLPEQKFLLRVTARGLTSLVKRVFGQMAMIFPLTETSRRHVYLAVLAKLDADNRLDEMDEPTRIALLERLLTLRNADLIMGTFG
ncbi:MAG: hypothetical protein ACNA7H_04970, partial [Desulfotignum sp.]